MSSTSPVTQPTGGSACAADRGREGCAGLAHVFWANPARLTLHWMGVAGKPRVLELPRPSTPRDPKNFVDVYAPTVAARLRVAIRDGQSQPDSRRVRRRGVDAASNAPRAPLVDIATPRRIAASSPESERRRAARMVGVEVRPPAGCEALVDMQPSWSTRSCVSRGGRL